MSSSQLSQLGVRCNSSEVQYCSSPSWLAILVNVLLFRNFSENCNYYIYFILAGKSWHFIFLPGRQMQSPLHNTYCWRRCFPDLLTVARHTHHVFGSSTHGGLLFSVPSNSVPSVSKVPRVKKLKLRLAPVDLELAWYLFTNNWSHLKK